MRKLINFFAAAWMVFGLVAVTDSALANSGKTTLVVVEFTGPETWEISETYGKIDYATQNECFARGNFLADYFQSIQVDEKYVVACVHLTTLTFDEVIELIGQDWKGQFTWPTPVGQPI